MLFILFKHHFTNKLKFKTRVAIASDSTFIPYEYETRLTSIIRVCKLLEVFVLYRNIQLFESTKHFNL